MFEKLNIAVEERNKAQDIVDNAKKLLDEQERMLCANIGRGAFEIRIDGNGTIKATVNDSKAGWRIGGHGYSGRSNLNNYSINFSQEEHDVKPFLGSLENYQNSLKHLDKKRDKVAKIKQSIASEIEQYLIGTTYNFSASNRWPSLKKCDKVDITEALPREKEFCDYIVNLISSKNKRSQFSIDQVLQIFILGWEGLEEIKEQAEYFLPKNQN